MTLFWSTVGLFLLLVALAVTNGFVRDVVLRAMGFAAIGAFLILSSALFIRAISSGASGRLKMFLALTGSAGTLFIALLLLAAIAGLLKLLLHVDVSPGQDGGWLGATAFVLALFICPTILAVGSLGTLVLLLAGRRVTRAHGLPARIDD